MAALLDEFRVGDDGTLYIGIMPPEEAGQGSGNVLSALPPETPCADRMRLILHRILHGLGGGEAVSAIVHDGDDRFTVILGQTDFHEVDGGSHPQIVGLIDDMAAIAWTAQSPNKAEFAGAEVSLANRHPTPRFNVLRFRPRRLERAIRNPNPSHTEVPVNHLAESNPDRPCQHVEPNRLVRRTLCQSK